MPGSCGGVLLDVKCVVKVWWRNGIVVEKNHFYIFDRIKIFEL